MEPPALEVNRMQLSSATTPSVASPATTPLVASPATSPAKSTAATTPSAFSAKKRSFKSLPRRTDGPEYRVLPIDQVSDGPPCVELECVEGLDNLDSPRAMEMVCVLLRAYVWIRHGG